MLTLWPATGQLAAGGWRQEAIPLLSFGRTPWVSGPQPCACKEPKGLTGSRTEGPFVGFSVLDGGPGQPTRDRVKQGPLTVGTGELTRPAGCSVQASGRLICQPHPHPKPQPRKRESVPRGHQSWAPDQRGDPDTNAQLEQRLSPEGHKPTETSPPFIMIYHYFY